MELIMFEYFACKSFDGAVGYVGELTEILPDGQCKINWYLDKLDDNYSLEDSLEYAGSKYILTKNLRGVIQSYSHAKKYYNMIPLHEIKKVIIKQEIKLVGNKEDILFLKSSVEFQEVISRLGIELKD
jgi:hypothetical protein